MTQGKTKKKALEMLMGAIIISNESIFAWLDQALGWKSP